MSDKNQKTAVSLPGVPGFDLATGELLSKDHVEALVNYAFKYALDPYRSHVCLMYGKPYITIDGYLFYARKLGKAYSLLSRPLDTKEAALYKIKETDHGWIAEVKFHDTGEVCTGLGIVTYEEMTAKSTKHPEQLRFPVVASHPWQLGQKRAEWQALRRAFPIGKTEERKQE